MPAHHSLLLAAAALAVIPAAALAKPIQHLSATLTAGAEVPGPGKPDANGSAVVRVMPDIRRVCYTVNYRNVPASTMAHVHQGAAGVAGPPVISLHRAGSHFAGCTTVAQSLARDLVSSPGNFYVNVHSRAFPAGAIRGQLHR
jgi:hypothetical protein